MAPRSRATASAIKEGAEPRACWSARPPRARQRPEGRGRRCVHDRGGADRLDREDAPRGPDARLPSARWAPQPPTTTISRGKRVSARPRAAAAIEGDEVLDAHPGLAVQVDPGLDREHGRARQRRLGRPPAERRQLVRRETDAVPESVPEVLAVPAVDDHRRGRSRPTARPAGSGRAGGRRPPRARSIAAAWARGDQLVDLEVARGRLADEQRPGHVAAIAGDLGAEVEQQDRAVADRPVARRAVRQRRLGAGQARRPRTPGPPRRRSASAIRAAARGRASVTPGRISGSSVASARSATAQAAAIRSISAGSLVARSASTQPSTGTSSTSGAAAASRSQVACGTNAGLDADASRPERADQLRPARRAGRRRPARARLRRLASRPGSCSASRRAARPRRRRRGTGPTCRRPSPRPPRARSPVR